MNQNNCAETSRWQRIKHSAVEKLPLLTGTAILVHTTGHAALLASAAHDHVHEEEGTWYHALDAVVHIVDNPVVLGGLGALMIGDYVIHKRRHKAYHTQQTEHTRLYEENTALRQELHALKNNERYTSPLDMHSHNSF